MSPIDKILGKIQTEGMTIDEKHQTIELIGMKKDTTDLKEETNPNECQQFH